MDLESTETPSLFSTKMYHNIDQADQFPSQHMQHNILEFMG